MCCEILIWRKHHGDCLTGESHVFKNFNKGEERIRFGDKKDVAHWALILSRPTEQFSILWYILLLFGLQRIGV